MLSKEELEFWAGQSSYTLHDAAFLWRDKDPQVKIPDSDRITSIVLNMLFSATCSRELEVTGGIIPGFTIRSEWMERETRTSPKITHRTRVSRESLIKLAKNQSVKPVFLFPGEQRPEECPLRNDEKDGETPIKVFVQSMKEEADGVLNASMHYEKKSDVSKVVMEYIDKSPNGVEPVPGILNTIKEFGPKSCLLTYFGVDSLLEGKAVPIIRELLLNPFEEFPAATINSMTSGEFISKPDDAEYEEENEVIQITAQEKAAWQSGITAMIEKIEDSKARLVVEENLDKKTEIEAELDAMENSFMDLKKELARNKGWVNKNGKVCYREKKTDEGGKVVVKQKKEYKNIFDGVSKLCKTAIERIQDENLKAHLKCINYGQKLSYCPKENIEWTNI